MINAVSDGIRRIKERIPERILDTALANYTEFGLDNAILDTIIVDSVIPDCNLGGGTTVQIKLEESWAEHTTDKSYGVYRIPAEHRSNRDLIEVHRIQYLPAYNSDYFAPAGVGQATMRAGTNPFFQESSIQRAQDSMVNSKTGMGSPGSSPKVSVSQGGLVRLYPAPGGHIPWLLTCRLEYDKNMTNLNSEALLMFITLCEMKAKMFCYNELIIKQDVGHIHFGAELSSIKDIISDWSSLHQDYSDLLYRFFSSASFDIQRIAPIIKMMI